jgi:hypothetical protein
MQDVRRSATESDSDSAAAEAAAAVSSTVVAPPAPSYGMNALNTLYSGLAPNAVRSKSQIICRFFIAIACSNRVQ